MSHYGGQRYQSTQHNISTMEGLIEGSLHLIAYCRWRVDTQIHMVDINDKGRHTAASLHITTLVN